MDRDGHRRVATTVAWGRAHAERVLRLTTVRRLLSALLRLEVVDRSMALAAQALLALLPLLVVAAAFLPDTVVDAGLDRVRAVTGIGAAQTSVLGEDVTGGVDVDQARSQAGVIGVLITVFSASSFSRAMQRAYERVWDQPHEGGLLGRRRSFVWLMAWLVGLQTLALLGGVLGRGTGIAGSVLAFTVRVLLAGLLWWWSLHFLLHQRVRWRPLLPAAAITGLAIVAYTAGSTLVMPAYATSSAGEFGALGLVLTVATWLVGFAGVLLVSAVTGRVVAEDPGLQALGRWITRGWRGAWPPRGSWRRRGPES
ncbi:MAG: ribonuclease [Aeromicrobium sp.]|jgi:membrane protein|uniref:YhjD/YihY/BrkB family envelope integrity protein n=1 Tax=Aeromicrobium sp. TaxID=1871063 RepID=UPI002634CC5B|nr:YhjD/YihY/BrkB family envelope integrity protein [Aeromicrobium sp.]MCW2823917.1 ribonuclease [Aeromicrobium sp.]